jgi:hypothetical protein
MSDPGAWHLCDQPVASLREYIGFDQGFNELSHPSCRFPVSPVTLLGVEPAIRAAAGSTIADGLNQVLAPISFSRTLF